MDALFGLPRKKAAGVSHRDSLHGEFFFGDQAAVDEHVVSYEMPKREPKVCLKYMSLIDFLRIYCWRASKASETLSGGVECKIGYILCVAYVLF